MIGRMLVAVIALCSTSCISTIPAYVDLPFPVESKGVTVTIDRTIRAPFGFVGVSGTVSNGTDEVLENCRITVRALGPEMNSAGRARTNVKALQPRETRDYAAKFPNPIKLIRTVLKPELRLTW